MQGLQFLARNAEVLVDRHASFGRYALDTMLDMRLSCVMDALSPLRRAYAGFIRTRKSWFKKFEERCLTAAVQVVSASGEVGPETGVTGRNGVFWIIAMFHVPFLNVAPGCVEELLRNVQLPRDVVLCGNHSWQVYVPYGLVR